MADLAQQITENIKRKVGHELRAWDVQTWSIAAQRQAIELSGRTVSTKTQSEVWREYDEWKNMMSTEARAAMIDQIVRQRECIEAGAKVAAAITDDELKAIVEEIEQCQQ